MSQALDALGPLADRVTPLVVTVDPERDTVEQLALYQQSFHPSFLMLTGTPEQVREAARAYRVYFRKADSDSATDYLKDHSSITFLKIGRATSELQSLMRISYDVFCFQKKHMTLKNRINHFIEIIKQCQRDMNTH